MGHFLKVLLLASLFISVLNAEVKLGDKNSFISLCYHNVADKMTDRSIMTVTTDQLISHFKWLKQNEYHPISLDDILLAKEGKRDLPKNAVLLTFDDGYKSFYTRIYPLLKIYGFPAVFGLVSNWQEISMDGMFSYGGKPKPREMLLSWEEVREMVDSGLVEITSHSYDAHKGVPSNPQGNSAAFYTTLIYDKNSTTYESETQYTKRVSEDLRRSTDVLNRHLGIRPRAIVWPYGSYNRLTTEMAAEYGMPIALTLNMGVNGLDDLGHIKRILVPHDVKFEHFFYSLKHDPIYAKRAMFINLDQIYNPDPKIEEKNLGKVIERVKRYGITEVYMKGYSDADYDGIADALYFPNPYMPVRSDLLNRAAWQTYTRSGLLNIYVWMPVDGFEIKGKKTSIYDEDDRRVIKDIYKHMGMQSFFKGIMFDNTLFKDDMIESVDYSVDFTKELTRQAEMFSGLLETVRVLNPNVVMTKEETTAQNDTYAKALDAYDHTVIKAFVYTPKVKESQRWLEGLVQKVSENPDGLKRTTFMLPSMYADDKHSRRIDTDRLIDQMKYLELNRATNFGYYPDDYLNDHPKSSEIRKVFSLETFPYKIR